MMRPLQVFVDERELDRLNQWASARGWTKSQAVRAALRALSRTGEDSLLAASGMIDGLPPDCAARFDRYLEETFVATKASRRPTRRRPAQVRLRR